ncbi:MAG: hypothetical protein GY710_13415 [Desulfobacteraceae bacterium]|nr:hypothetical protein [Desulfobacteraceae bacterium]
MDIKQLDQIFIANAVKKDSIDIPDCFGEYNKKNKLCSTYCSISIKCCVMRTNHPKIDTLEKLLLHNDYAVKPH